MNSAFDIKPEDNRPITQYPLHWFPGILFPPDCPICGHAPCTHNGHIDTPPIAYQMRHRNWQTWDAERYYCPKCSYMFDVVKGKD